ncbi:protein Mo9 [Beluga whale alphaherpesvirus 1]|uniref:Protein Mo9 n=1 Tax=Beluga whale alphaherpesvirus 1 TaxID=1434720 RepID=A0A286MMA6_9ALPH|nr:protein Mo9 [Beluga whale alphaherpesvirus 1]ASW27132.1 protein Mo9 [Beluga whale alphaherpesvirus 1]
MGEHKSPRPRGLRSSKFEDAGGDAHRSHDPGASMFRPVRVSEVGRVGSGSGPEPRGGGRVCRRLSEHPDAAFRLALRSPPRDARFARRARSRGPRPFPARRKAADPGSWIGGRRTLPRRICGPRDR